MSKEGYLAISILVLVALGALALGLFFLLRKGKKVERPHCVGCGEVGCPLAKAKEEEKQ